MKKDPKKKTRSKAAAKRAAQNVINKYCRMRDSYGNGGAHCISCGEWTAYDESDGGHFIPTTSSAIRFDERNINLQCRRCNRFMHGNPRHYYKGMLKKYGQKVVDELESREFESKRWSAEELKEIRDYYGDKIRRLERGEPPQDTNNSGMAVLDLFTGVDETGEVSRT